MRHCSVLLAFACFLALPACQTGGPRITGPTRAIWVTRFDYRTADDVKMIIENCHESGFNTILFQVRGNGTAFYQSELEPWADELAGADPGFDPLRLACEEAHSRGMDLHAWINVMPSWRGDTPPTNPSQLYNARPDWHWYDQNGDRQPLVKGFYVSLNPCLNEVRSYLVDVCEEIVTGYDVDGLHLDYIRFVDDLCPENLDYPRDTRTELLFLAKTGKHPDQDRNAWDTWRSAQVTALVRSIGNMIRDTKEQIIFSAAVGSMPEGPRDRHLRDSAAWTRLGLVDAVFPMNYTADLATFSDRATAWKELSVGSRIITGINVRPTDRTPDQVRRQIMESLDKSPHFCLFAYSYLFDSTGSGTAENPARTRLREAVIPLVKSLEKAEPDL